jgi:hypothetical protein
MNVYQCMQFASPVGKSNKPEPRIIVKTMEESKLDINKLFGKKQNKERSERGR